MVDLEPAPSTIVVFSLSNTTFFAVPRSSIVVVSSASPTSSEITLPPVNTAISSSIAFLRSPNPGALHAATFTMPRMLLTTNVARASPSTSSAIIISALPDFATPSRRGIKSLILEIFLSKRRTNGSSSTTFILS